MRFKAYLSNVSPAWPWRKQEELLKAAVPDWPKGVTVLRDDLDEKQRMGRRRDALIQRDEIVRASSRRHSDDVILVASLAVLDWSAEGMLEAITAISARGATVRALDVGIDIGPQATAASFLRAAEAFAAARRKSQQIIKGQAGGRASADSRSASAKAAAEKIRERWKMPSDQYRTEDLLAEAGISRNTANVYLGKRSDAQRIYQASAKRKVSAYAKRGKARNA